MGETIFFCSAWKTLEKGEELTRVGRSDASRKPWGWLQESSREQCEESAPVTRLPGLHMRGLQRRRYLAVHGDVEADAVELQQVPVEPPLGVPVVGGSSAGDIGQSSESHSSSAEAVREEGCLCRTIAGATMCLGTPCVLLHSEAHAAVTH